MRINVVFEPIYSVPLMFPFIIVSGKLNSPLYRKAVYGYYWYTMYVNFLNCYIWPGTIYNSPRYDCFCIDFNWNLVLFF